jgi:hypothetical protein
MKTYITTDGERYPDIRDARQLLRQMRARAFFRYDSQLEWMNAFARRVFQETRKRVRTDTEAHFVADLLKTGLLKDHLGD